MPVARDFRGFAAYAVFGNTQSFPAFDIGPAGPNRRIAIGIGSFKSSATDIAALTVGGVAIPNKIANGSTPGTEAQLTEMWEGPLPDGLGGAQDIVFSAAPGTNFYNSNISVWIITDADPLNPVVQAVAATPGTQAPDLSLNVAAEGELVALVWRSFPDATAAWVGATADGKFTDGGGGQMFAASESTPVDATPHALSVSFNTVASQYIGAVAVSYRPVFVPPPVPVPVVDQGQGGGSGWDYETYVDPKEFEEDRRRQEEARGRALRRQNRDAVELRESVSQAITHPGEVTDGPGTVLADVAPEQVLALFDPVEDEREIQLLIDAALKELFGDDDD